MSNLRTARCGNVHRLLTSMKMAMAETTVLSVTVYGNNVN